MKLQKFVRHFVILGLELEYPDRVLSQLTFGYALYAVVVLEGGGGEIGILGLAVLEVFLYRRVGELAAGGIVKPDVIVFAQVALAFVHFGQHDEDGELLARVPPEYPHLGYALLFAGFLRDNGEEGAVVLAGKIAQIVQFLEDLFGCLVA